MTLIKNNPLTPAIAEALDKIVKARVERLEGDDVVCICSHDRAIREAFPHCHPVKIGQALKSYVEKHRGEWDVDVHHTNATKYWISKKPTRT